MSEKGNEKVEKVVVEKIPAGHIKVGDWRGVSSHGTYEEAVAAVAALKGGPNKIRRRAVGFEVKRLTGHKYIQGPRAPVNTAVSE